MEAEQVKSIASNVSVDRMMDRIGQLAQQAPSGSGGVTRLAFSPEEARGMEMVARWMEEAGLTVAYDGLGNMFGSTDGNAPGAGVIMAGSHIDSVPNGGSYDGILGVVGAIEAVEAIKAAGFRPAIPLEVVVWRCEEAALFGQGRLGSLFFTGELDLETVYRWDRPDAPVADRLEELSGLPQRAEGRHLKGYLELHIEQGRRLESSRTPIGVVTAIPGATRWRITITGRADHSGATPMGLRHDALAAAAELVLAVERAGLQEKSNETVATGASIRVLPGAWNVVPGWAELLTDIRGIDQESIDRTLNMVKDEASRIAVARGVGISFEDVTRGVPVRMDQAMVDRVMGAARQLGLSAALMPSGAGHDAQTIAPYAPTGMVFIPSIGGVSHSPDELSRPEDIQAGVQVLAAAWAAVASPEK